VIVAVNIVLSAVLIVAFSRLFRTKGDKIEA
jgi:hypothetical protein